MNIDNEDAARNAIEVWRQEPARAQLRNLQLAVEKLELGQMYYEQKGNDQGVQRLGRCLVLLTARLGEVEKELQG